MIDSGDLEEDSGTAKQLVEAFVTGVLNGNVCLASIRISDQLVAITVKTDIYKFCMHSVSKIHVMWTGAYGFSTITLGARLL